MKAIATLQQVRNHYSPIQPCVPMGKGHEVIYQEMNPDVQLQPFIYCYWQLKTTKALQQPFLYRVVSDGCIDIFFNVYNLAESFVMGFSKKYTEFPIGYAFHYAGVRFLPGAFTQLFDIPAKALSEKDQLLVHFLPSLATFIAKIRPASFFAVSQQLDQYFITFFRQVQSSLQVDHRFYEALLYIFEKNGHVETELELNTGLSPRQLRRLFNHYIGTTPKRFSQVVRFQFILNAKPSTQSLKFNSLYYDVGFYDQAHFIKEFKKFYGVTPARAFR